MEVELTRKTEVSEWIDENDESIAKAYLIDRVKDTRETVIERNIEWDGIPCIQTGRLSTHRS